MCCFHERADGLDNAARGGAARRRKGQRQGRLALASLLGGVYAAGAALLPLLAALPVRVLAGAALCLAAFCGERALLRLGGLYFLTAAAFAGLAAALARSRTAAAVRRRVLLCRSAASAAARGGARLHAQRHPAARRRKARLHTARHPSAHHMLFRPRTARARAGGYRHSLTEPVSGKPVLILCRGEAALLLNDPLDGDAAHQLTAPAGRDGGALRSRAIPRRRDRESGLLLYFRPDRVLEADGKTRSTACAAGPPGFESDSTRA